MKTISKIAQLECEANRLVRLIKEIQTGRRSRRVVKIGETLVKEHVRRAHTRICWTKKPGKPVQIEITERTGY